MMQKSWLATAVTVALSISVSSAFAATYTDVQSNWAQSDINNMVDRNVMSGFNDGMFHPEAWVTRAEFTAMSARALGLSPSQSDQIPALRKISRNDYHYNNVDNSALISAYPSGVYRPENPLRRVEMLTGVSGTLVKPLVSTEEANQILSQYADADQVPSNLRREVATAIKYNLFAIDPQLGNNRIEPLRPATRAEVASVLNTLNENRELTIVRNGQVVATANSGETIAIQETGSPATTSSTYSTTSSSESTTSTMGNTQTTTTTTTSYSTPTSTTGTTSVAATGDSSMYGSTSDYSRDQSPPSDSTKSYSPYTNAPKKTWVMGSTVPFRNSADTIAETRMINQTTTPNNLEATIPSTLPTNVTFMTTVAKALYSEYNKPGDPVLLIMDHGLTDASDKIVLPAGTRLFGFVTNVVPHNEQGATAQLGIQLTQAVTPTGQRIPISATVANSEGVLKAGDFQGIAFRPDHSLAALKREIHTAEGALYGTKTGKASVLEEPYATQVSDKPLDPMDKRSTDIVIGVGDKLQIRLGDASAVNQ